MPSPLDAAPNTMSPAAGYTAIVLAGKRPGVDPVAAANGETYKARVQIAGIPMLTRVLAALGGSAQVRHVVIVAGEQLGDIREISGADRALGDRPLTVVRAQATLSESVLSAIASRPAGERFLVTTSDHALLTPAMVDDFLAAAVSHAGVCIAFVEQTTIERVHENMKRTYLRFRGACVSGANLFAINTSDGLKAVDFFKRVEANRKTPLKIVSTLGVFNLIGFLLRRFTLEEGFARLSGTLDCPIRPVLLDHANAAVDVDSIADLQTVENILAQRRGCSEAPAPGAGMA